MAANPELAPPTTPERAAPLSPPPSSRPAPIEAAPVPAPAPVAAPAPAPVYVPAPALIPPPVEAPEVEAHVQAASTTEPLFTVEVWQLGVAVLAVLAVLLYALGIV